MDPAKKQYLIFCFVVSLIIGIIINFAFVDIVKGTLLYGIPFNLGESEGVGNFLIRVVNTLLSAGILTFPIYYIFRELERKR